MADPLNVKYLQVMKIICLVNGGRIFYGIAQNVEG
jgi:hypothetical protein